MARTARHVSQDPFARQGDFNEQLYLTLRQAPWWMISIAIHLVLFFILNLINTTEAHVLPPKMVEAGFDVPDEVDLEPEPTPDISKPLDQSNIPNLQPDLKERTDEPEQRDTDSLHQEDYGLVDAESEGVITGPSNNRTIGLTGGGGAFGGRGRGSNKTGGRGPRGGTRQDAVMDALQWLKSHQSPNGSWEADGFQRWCDMKPAEAGKMPTGVGKQAMYDAGVTGLALCAFLGAGYTNRGNHPFKKTVSRGLRYLKNVQDPEGCFGARAAGNFIYNHAIASLAMVEAYGMTSSTIYKSSAQRALEFIGLARNPYFAWRYGVKPGDNDTSVTGWMMMAIKSAKLINGDARKSGKAAPFVIDDDAFSGIEAWLDKVTDPDSGRVGYITRGSGPARPKHLVDRFPNEKSEAMTAAACLARIFMGKTPEKDRMLEMGADICKRMPPTWNEADGSIDMYYWYYGALAMHQMGGSHWKTWKAALRKAVIETQRKDTSFCEYKGSWEPAGPWGEDGGRVYSTAMLAMCLQVVERYERVPGLR
jgi:hypothetical protein